MPEDKDLTEGTLPNEQDVSSVDGDSAVGKEATPAITLDALKEALGKDFKDVDGALKSITDTFKHVGEKTEKVKEEVKKEVTSEGGYVTKEQYERDMFYTTNPDYKANEAYIEAIALSKGIDRNDVLETPEYKTLDENFSMATQAKESSNVLKPSSRLSSDAKTKDKLETAKSEGTTEAWADVLSDIVQ
jgi:hypothetical protein